MDARIFSMFLSIEHINIDVIMNILRMQVSARVWPANGIKKKIRKMSHGICISNTYGYKDTQCG